MALFNVLISSFPGGTPPVSFPDLLKRINDDGGMTAIAQDVRWRVYSGAKSVDIVFDITPVGGEPALINGHVSAAAGVEIASVEGWLANFGAATYRGYFENLTAATTSSSTTPANRINQSPTLVDGRYRITIVTSLNGSAASTVADAIFTFDGVVQETFPAGGSNKYVYARQHVVAAGVRPMLLQVARSAGGGQAEMSASTLTYQWMGVS